MKTIKRNKLVCGVGLNDADYNVYSKINGKQVMCKFYKTWSNMIRRCYSEIYQKKNPTYICCTVNDCWLVFSNFKKWMETKDFKEKQLDKDLKVAGNKVYGPDNCMFVSSSINKILINSVARIGICPQGVYFDKRTEKYCANVSDNIKTKYLGAYTTIKEAELAYLIAKHKIVKQAASDEADQEVSQALHMQAGLILDKLKVVGALE